MFQQVSPRVRPRSCIPHHRVLCALCFHGLTNCFSRNSFRFTSIQIAGGWGEAGKTVGRVCTMQPNKPAFINLRTLVVPKKRNALIFSQSKLFGQSTRRGCPHHSVPNLALSQASKSVHSFGKLPPTRLGAIIPLCTPNIWRRAFVSLANCHCFSWG